MSDLFRRRSCYWCGQRGGLVKRGVYYPMGEKRSKGICPACLTARFAR